MLEKEKKRVKGSFPSFRINLKTPIEELAKVTTN
jgi:hypothetical protein